jgi:hypothetical protein
MDYVRGMMGQDQTLLIVGIIIVIGILGYQMYKQGYFNKLLGKTAIAPVPLNGNTEMNSMPQMIDFKVYTTVDEINAALEEYKKKLQDEYSIYITEVEAQAADAIAAIGNGTTGNNSTAPFRVYNRPRF